ncbi:MAG TPA: sensor histidine kinase, partial [Flavipsychrobacter sp.]|nr:sensor histidine kinase [Flavipsychrobacter sp.]
RPRHYYHRDKRFYYSILILQETTAPLNEATSILVLVSVILLFTLFAVSTILYITLQKKKQYSQHLEKQKMEHRFDQQLLQSRLEVQEQTLKNLSAELHDNIAQVLGAVKLQLHMLATGAVSEEQQTLAKAAAENMRDAIRDVRGMSHVMNGSYVLRKGLHESIEKDLASIVAAHRIKCNFTQSGSTHSLGEDRELILFRIIQESVANAVKHGRPATIMVSLNYRPDALQVTVRDDGRGFDRQLAKQNGGVGIMNIEERTKLLKGTLHINSEPDKGTNIVLTIPHPDK